MNGMENHIENPIGNNNFIWYKWELVFFVTDLQWIIYWMSYQNVISIKNIIDQKKWLIDAFFVNIFFTTKSQPD